MAMFYSKNLMISPTKFTLVHLSNKLKRFLKQYKIGTGHGIIISIPYKGRDVILDEKVNIDFCLSGGNNV